MYVIIVAFLILNIQFINIISFFFRSFGFQFFFSISFVIRKNCVLNLLPPPPPFVCRIEPALNAFALAKFQTFFAYKCLADCLEKNNLVLECPLLFSLLLFQMLCRSTLILPTSLICNCILK